MYQYVLRLVHPVPVVGTHVLNIVVWIYTGILDGKTRFIILMVKKITFSVEIQCSYFYWCTVSSSWIYFQLMQNET